MTTDRKRIYDKTGGRCAYCGCELNGKFHADHIAPVFRNKKKPEGMDFPERDNEANKYPACFSCNHYKSTYTIEQFREQLGLLVGRLNEHTTIYRIANRYGLIEETNKQVVFYFEKINI